MKGLKLNLFDLRLLAKNAIEIYSTWICNLMKRKIIRFKQPTKKNSFIMNATKALNTTNL